MKIPLVLRWASEKLLIWGAIALAIPYIAFFYWWFRPMLVSYRHWVYEHSKPMHEAMGIPIEAPVEPFKFNDAIWAIGAVLGGFLYTCVAIITITYVAKN